MRGVPRDKVAKAEGRMEKAESKKRKAARRDLLPRSAYCLLLSAFCVLPSVFSSAQAPAPAAPGDAPADAEAPLAGDWAPQLLDAILSSPNVEAGEALHRAAFAAGPATVPQLQTALKDDRTAEFAAQSLAFIGGPRALEILSKLMDDPRDLNLRRFFYGALGEFPTPQATEVLLEAVNRADAEPDRTVTEAAILALTVRSDATVVPRLRDAETKIKDVVIRLDLENALEVIERRARYLASPEGKKAGGSIEQAVRIYFMPALEPPPPGPAASRSPARHSAPIKPQVSVQIQSLTFSPVKMRALARVVFEDASAMAYYDMVLQKQFGDWTLASVWLGAEVEKTAPQRTPVRSRPK